GRSMKPATELDCISVGTPRSPEESPMRRTPALVASLSIVAAAGAAFAAADTSSAPVTFSKDVAPILEKNCQTCHRPDDIAPMSLLTYKEARPWAKSIRQQVADRTMPPWHADAAPGTFSN